MKQTLPQSQSAKQQRDLKHHELDDLVYELGGESILAGMVIRQAAKDLHDVRVGKRPKSREWPGPGDWAAASHEPIAELHDFFASKWFAFLSDHIGQDPAALLRVVRS